MIVMNEILQMAGKFYLLLYTLMDCRLDDNICFQMHYYWCLSKALSMESFLLLRARMSIDKSRCKGNQLKTDILTWEFCELKWEVEKHHLGSCCISLLFCCVHIFCFYVCLVLF